MKLIEAVRQKLNEAVKENSPKKDIYRALLARIQNDELKAAKELSEEETEASIRAVATANTKAIQNTKKEMQEKGVQLTPALETHFRCLEIENEVIAEFLPALLTGEQIKSMMRENEALMSTLGKAANDNAAVGVGMKHLKTQGAKFDGSTAREAILALITEAKAAL